MPMKEVSCRVRQRGPLQRLELHAGKLARAVLRGRGCSNAILLPDQTLETKMKFITQVMTGSSEIRSVEEVELAALSYAEVKAIASGNPMVLEKAGVDAEVAKLSVLEHAYRKRQNEMRWRIKHLASSIDHGKASVFKGEADVKAAEACRSWDFCTMDGRSIPEREEAGKAIVISIERVRHMAVRHEMEIGKIGPFLVHARKSFGEQVALELTGHGRYDCNEIKSVSGAVLVLRNAVDRVPAHIESLRQTVVRMERESAELARELEKPFEYDSRLRAVLARQREVDIELGLYQDQSGSVEAA